MDAVGLMNAESWALRHFNPRYAKCTFNHRFPHCSRLALSIQFDKIKTMKSENAIASLGALAQESRLAIYRILVKRGPDGYTPGDLVAKTDIPAPTLSFHLKELQRAELVTVRREGRFLHYSANFTQMRELVDFLTENCCSLADEACDTACKPLPATQAKRKRA